MLPVLETGVASVEERVDFIEILDCAEFVLETLLCEAKSLELESRAGNLMNPIANFFTSIRNASAKTLEKVDVPYSKMKLGISKILKEEGYIQSFRVMEENQMPFIRIQLKYTLDRQAIIKGLKLVSKPGLKIYEKSNKLPRVQGGMGIAILSTSKGLMTNRKAKVENVGGEILCKVW